MLDFVLTTNTDKFFGDISLDTIDGTSHPKEEQLQQCYPTFWHYLEHCATVV